MATEVEVGTRAATFAAGVLPGLEHVGHIERLASPGEARRPARFAAAHACRIERARKGCDRLADEVGHDLARRDFTINAIAWHPLRDELLDPFGGMADLEAGVLRTVGVAVDRFAEVSPVPVRLQQQQPERPPVARFV